MTNSTHDPKELLAPVRAAYDTAMRTESISATVRLDAIRFMLDTIEAQQAENARLRETGTKLALTAGVLNVALDGQGRYANKRQAVANAMNDFRAALNKESTQ